MKTLKIIITLFIVTLFSCESNKLKKKSLVISFKCEDSWNIIYKLQGLNGIKSNDSIPILPILDCYDLNNSYEIIWSPKMSLKAWKKFSVDFKHTNLIKEGKINNFNKFNIYKIEVPIVNPESLNDIHSMNMKFPTKVTIYKAKNNRWIKIKKQSINDFTSYSSLVFDLFYNKINKDNGTD